MTTTVLQSKESALQSIFARAAKEKFRKVVVLHGRSFSEALSLLSDSMLENVFFKSGIPENPSIEYVHNLFNELALEKEDLVLGIGGGSIIDTSKLLVALATGISEEQLLNNHINDQGIPHLWIAPTTAGSGSEATHFAVVYKAGKKFSVAHNALLPNQVFIEPSFTLSCPPSVTVASGVDALCQAIESFWAPGANDESREYAVEALSLVVQNLPKLVDSPNDLQARRKMLEGAHLAGKAINITKTTAGHALSYGVTSELGIPHGMAVLLVMGPLVELMDKKFNFFGSNMVPLAQALQSFGNDFVTAFLAFRSHMIGAFVKNKPLVESKSTNDLSSRLTTHVNVERLSNHPVSLTNKDLLKIFSDVADSIG